MQKSNGATHRGHAKERYDCIDPPIGKLVLNVLGFDLEGRVVDLWFFLVCPTRSAHLVVVVVDSKSSSAPGMPHVRRCRWLLPERSRRMMAGGGSR